MLALIASVLGVHDNEREDWVVGWLLEYLYWANFQMNKSSIVQVIREYLMCYDTSCIRQQEHKIQTAPCATCQL